MAEQHILIIPAYLSAIILILGNLLRVLMPQLASITGPMLAYDGAKMAMCVCMCMWGVCGTEEEGEGERRKGKVRGRVESCQSLSQ